MVNIWGRKNGQGQKREDINIFLTFFFPFLFFPHLYSQSQKEKLKISQLAESRGNPYTPASNKKNHPF